MFYALNVKGAVVAATQGTMAEAVRLADQWNADRHVNPDMVVSQVANNRDPQIATEVEPIAVQLLLSL